MTMETEDEERPNRFLVGCLYPTATGMPEIGAGGYRPLPARPSETRAAVPVPNISGVGVAAHMADMGPLHGTNDAEVTRK
jgi:hypothetical protein